MAKYDYRCTDCDDVMEVEHRISGDVFVKCSKCGGCMVKVFLQMPNINTKIRTRAGKRAAYRIKKSDGRIIDTPGKEI